MWHALEGIRQIGKGRLFLLGALTGGHTAIHWFQQLFPVILPEIKIDLRLNDVQVGSLSAAREAVSGVLALPSGFLADTCRRQMGGILAVSLAFGGLAYLLVGLSSAYIWVVLAMALVGVGTALWHPAANASLSARFPVGRRAVLVPGMASLGLLYFTLALASSGVQLGLVIAAIGLFFYGLGNITMAGVMDVAGSGVQATCWGLMSVLSHLLTTPSPMIAGLIVSKFGVRFSFFYASALLLLAAVVLLSVHAQQPGGHR